MRTYRLIACIFGIAATLLIYSGSADAATGHKLLFSFGSGSFTKPVDMTTDRATGDVYVADSRANVVDIFGAEGGTPSGILTPLMGPSELPFNFSGEQSAVAIDESGEPGDPSKGDLYVSDTGHGVVDKFRLSVSGEYEYVCRFTGYGRGCVEKPTEEPSWKEPSGVAIDSHGDLYVANFGPGSGAVSEFSPEGQDIRQLSGGDIGVGAGPVGVAVDSANNLYVNNYSHSVVKIDPEGHESFLDTDNSWGVAVDAAGDVFVDDSSEEFVPKDSRIVEYNQAGEEVDDFGKEIVGASEGVAVNDTTGDVYVSDLSNDDVLVFGPVTVPATKTEGSSAVKGTTAKLAGSVNPEGLEAHYFYEYGSCGSPTSCSKSPFPEKTSEEALENPTGTESEPANTSLAGLTPETRYHYRIVGVNSNGVKQGKEAIFTTGPAVTGVSACRASSVLPVSAILDGVFEPEGFETLYHFEYATAEEFAANSEYTHFSEFELSSAEAQVSATAPIAELEAGTTYHCRLFAFSFEHGVTTGQDSTFTTPPALPTVDIEPPFATDVAPHEATLHGAISPGRGVTRYHFVYGLTPAYGSSTEEAYTQLNADEVAVAHEGKEITSYPVEQLVAGLPAGTTVHYALVAANATGGVVGPDKEFATLASLPPVEEAIGAGGSPLEVVPTSGIVQPSAPSLLPLPAFPAIRPLKTQPPVKCRKGFVKKAGKCVRKKPTRMARRRKH